MNCNKNVFQLEHVYSDMEITNKEWRLQCTFFCFNRATSFQTWKYKSNFDLAIGIVIGFQLGHVFSDMEMLDLISPEL
jgi:hypothetical protein